MYRLFFYFSIILRQLSFVHRIFGHVRGHLRQFAERPLETLLHFFVRHHNHRIFVTRYQTNLQMPQNSKHAIIYAFVVGKYSRPLTFSDDPLINFDKECIT